MKRTRSERRADRYQYQSWLVKRWRDRHLLPVPWYALRLWWLNRSRKGDDALPWRHCWSIERGLADVRRNHLFDLHTDLNGKEGAPMR